MYSSYRILDNYDQFNFINGVGTGGLTNAVQPIKNSQAKFGGWIINNPDAAVRFVQLFFRPAAGVALGATPPDLVLKVGNNGSVAFLDMIPIDCRDGLSVAATTTETGAIAPTTPLTGFFWIAK